MASYIKSRKHARSTTPQLTSAAAATLIAIAMPVGAQTNSLSEVKVEATADSYKPTTASSPKFTQPLVDTPQTITVIKKEVLIDQGATTLTEALRNTPGITFQMGENGNTSTGDAVFMRGFDTSGSIFVDGIRDLGTISRDVFNIEQIEVVKGPAGTDIGRGAPTGYINLSSKLPTAENFVAGTVSVGSGSQKRATADINRSLDETGTRAFRLNLLGQDGGIVNRDEVKNKRWGVAPSLAFGLGTPTRAYFSYLYMDQKNRPDGGLPTIGLDGYYLAQLARIGGNGPRVDTSNYYGYTSDHDDVRADMATARIEHDIAPGVTLRNITRWGRTKQDLVLTAPFSNGLITPNLANPAGWLVRLLPQGKLQENEILTNQTNVTADLTLGGLKHSLSAGAEFSREEQKSSTLAAQANATNSLPIVTNGVTQFQPYTSLYAPDINRAFVPVTPNGARVRAKTNTAALYAFDTIKLNDQWLINGGVRYEHYKTDYTSLAAPAANGSQAVTDLSGSDNLLTGKVGVVYKPASNGSIYAAYATSARPPGSDFALAGNTTAANGTVSTNVNNPSLDPQKAKTAEVGTKWDVLDNRLALTGALFKTTNENEQVQVDAFGTTEQYGKTRIQGLELSAVGQITPAWQIIAGVANVNTKILEGARTSTTQNGAQIRYSPKVTATLWTTYKLPMGLTLGGGARYVDTQARSTTNAASTSTTFFPEIPSYTVFDAMVGYEVNKNVSIQLNIYNLADKFYLARVNNAGNRLVIGTPRSALLTANFKF